MRKKRLPKRFFEAAMDGDAKTLDKLLSAGADPCAKGSDGMTAAEWAVMAGHADCLRFLLLAGAEVDSSNERGFTLAMLAATGAKAECLRLLIEAGADFNAASFDGRTIETLANGACVHVAATERARRAALAEATELRGMLEISGDKPSSSKLGQKRL